MIYELLKCSKVSFIRVEKNKSFAKIKKYKYFIINRGKRWIKNLQNKVLKD